MIGSLTFELPNIWVCAVPIAALFGLAAWLQRRRGLPWSRVGASAGLRLSSLVLLLFLMARPVRTDPLGGSGTGRSVVVLVDRSQSMSLSEPDTTRYERALDFLTHRLLPALQSANLPVQPMLFADRAELASGKQISSARPNGRRTNLGRAIAEAIDNSAQPPLAVIALTDGVATEDAENARAMSSLAEHHVPFLGVGFGDDRDIPSVSVLGLNGPDAVAPNITFSLAATVELLNGEQPAPCSLDLYRDGQLVQQRTVRLDPNHGARIERFQLREPKPGLHQYSVELMPPKLPRLSLANARASTSVRTYDGQPARVLYVQGALTWDYKFIRLALREDPALRLTGLTKTSQGSEFRQNVESADELVNGFPRSLEELAPFRVVVLSDLSAQDLSADQQELLARFCAEQGGGVLMMGGASSFEHGWQNTRLEQILPVMFSAAPATSESPRPFHLQLTPQASANPVFQLADGPANGEAWARLPTFSYYARVERPKLGAQSWMIHPADHGPDGARVLMASQRYGSGLTAVLCLQNFWRWRLAGDCDPAQFDRFWRQMFRWLGAVGRQDVSIELPDQRFCARKPVRVLLAGRASPQETWHTNQHYIVEVEDARHQVLEREAMDLQPAQPTEFRFRPPGPQLYTLRVSDGSNNVVAARSIEIPDANVELVHTGRAMDNLRRWASVSDGWAFKAEDCPSGAELVARLKSTVRQVRPKAESHHIVGLNGWNLTLVLGCLAGEWLLRKRWSLL